MTPNIEDQVVICHTRIEFQVSTWRFALFISITNGETPSNVEP